MSRIRFRWSGAAVAAVLSSLAAAPAPAIAQYRIAAPEPPAAALARSLRQLASSPRDFNALIGAGRASLALGDTQSAIGFFGRAEEVWPGHPSPKAGTGAALAAMGDARTALGYFEQAVRLGATAPMIGADRGLAYDLIGDQPRAQADYRAALVGHDGDEARRRLALSLAISGRRAEALQTLAPLMARRDPGANRVRALVLALTGDVAGARLIAEYAMPGAARSIEPFLRRLASLRPEEKAAAVHFGHMPDASSGPAPTSIASVATAPVRTAPPPPAVSRPAAPPRSVPSATAAVPPAPTASTGAPRSPFSTAAAAPIASSPAPPPVTAAPAEPLRLPPSLGSSGREQAAAVAGQPSVPASGDSDRLAGIDDLLTGIGEASAAGPIKLASNEPAVPPPSRPRVEARPPSKPKLEVAPAKPKRADKQQADDKPDEEDEPTDKKAAASKDEAAGKASPAKKEAPKNGAFGKKVSADKKQASANKEAAEKKEAPARKEAAAKSPGKHWVQLAGGARAERMPLEYRRIKAKKPALFARRTPHVAELKGWSRLLVGPFKSGEEAQEFVNTLAAADIQAFSWTAPTGQSIEKLPAK